MFREISAFNAIAEATGGEIKRKINAMSEKTAMWIIGGLLTLIMLLSTSFVTYFVKQNDKRIEILEMKYDKLSEKYNSDISSINLKLERIAVKLDVKVK